MYAIVKTGGQQHRVEEHSIIEINKINVAEGEEVVFDEILILAGDGDVKVGTPSVPGVKVVAKVLKQFRGPKIDGFTYKPKKHTQRHWGHRQSMTRVVIQSIQVS